MLHEGTSGSLNKRLDVRRYEAKSTLGIWPILRESFFIKN